MSFIDLTLFFHEDHFVPHLKANTKEGVLRELLQPLLNSKNVKSESIVLTTLLRRETLGSTGIGKGVAIPHCRTLAVSQVNVVAGISKKGIDYHAIDKKNVYIFFLIVAPPQEKSSQYLPLLGKIVEIVRDAKIRRLLKNVDVFSEFLKIMTGE